MFDISMEMDGFWKDYEVTNYFEIVHAGKFSHARVRKGMTGLA